MWYRAIKSRDSELAKRPSETGATKILGKRQTAPKHRNRQRKNTADSGTQASTSQKLALPKRLQSRDVTASARAHRMRLAFIGMREERRFKSHRSLCAGYAGFPFFSAVSAVNFATGRCDARHF